MQANMRELYAFLCFIFTSGMLHTGFDALEDSVELDCIRRTQARIVPLCENLGIPVNKIGATMVAWNEYQVQQFPNIIRKSNAAGCSSIRQLSVSELRQMEPHLQSGALGALHVANEAVTDPWLVPVLLANIARHHGAEILTCARVTSVTWGGKGWSIETTRGTFPAKCVVNCGGLYGDVVDKLAGLTNFRIKPRKGQYTMYSQSAHHLINSSIVPVPTNVGKGVIVFRSIYDNVVVGPTAEEVASRERAGIDGVTTDRLTHVARETVPQLLSHEVVNMYTGVRPATEVKDYIIKASPERNWVTVGGIRSTGLSGCLGIAERVRELVDTSLKLEPTRGRQTRVTAPDVRFTGSGTALVDGVEHHITHPLTITGTMKAVSARL